VARQRHDQPPLLPGGEESLFDLREAKPGAPVPARPPLRPAPSFPDPPPLTSHGPARVVAVCNQKGGVGKTTTAINLGAALAELGRRVLLIDLDPQGALSVGLGVAAPALERTVNDVLMRRTPIEEVVLKTYSPLLDLAPANIDLSGAEIGLVSEVGREQVLADAVDDVVDDYDVVLIDCQPSLGLLTVNALTAADGVLIPLECEYFALRGVALLVDTITKVRDRLNGGLEIEGVLATMYDGRTTHSRDVLARLIEAFGDKVFQTVVSRTVRFPETTVVGAPIINYDSSSNGAEAYRQLARELLARWAPADEPAAIQAASEGNASVERAPVERASVERAPVERAPVERAPVGAAPEDDRLPEPDRSPEA